MSINISSLKRESRPHWNNGLEAIRVRPFRNARRQVDMPAYFEDNLRLLKGRFPKVAEFALSRRDLRFSILKAKDGGVYYAIKGAGGQWQAISDPVNPIKTAQRSIDSMGERLTGGMSPALVVGLAPGYVLETVFTHFESRTADFEPFRFIYVLVDSAPCLCAWLASADRSRILKRPEVEFHLASEAAEIAALCESDLTRSHLFIPVSELPPHIVERIIQPLAELFLKRDAEATRRRKENDDYYAALDDASLAKIIRGEAGRKPRLLMPSHTSSTVLQFSARDTCELFESAGWETRLLKIERDLPPWHLIKAIHEFKPDLFLFIDHLRTEDAEGLLYPKDMLFATWVQDSLPAINSKAAAETWNLRVQGRNRDFLAGYVDQLHPYGYEKGRLHPMPMVVNPKIFHRVELTAEETAKYACDICFASNRGWTTEEAVERNLAPALAPLGIGIDTLRQIHDRLWEDYRQDRKYTDYKALAARLLEIESFSAAYGKLKESDQDYAIQRIFWLLNDLIYRYVVLEWLDAYAKAHPGFKLKLYGRGWERHPVFSRHAAGAMEHGPDLNKAYNAAKRCLHLNSVEGQHQRLMEIIAGGALPLTRGVPMEPTQTRNDFCQMFSHLATDGWSGLSKTEREELSDFLFSTAARLLRQEPTLTDGDLKKSVMDILDRRVQACRRFTFNLGAQTYFDSRQSLWETLDKTGGLSMDERHQAMTEGVAGLDNVAWLRSFIVLRLLGGKAPFEEALDKAALDFARLSLRQSCTAEELHALFDRIENPGPSILTEAIRRFMLCGEPVIAGRLLKDAIGDPSMESQAMLEQRLSLVLIFMQAGDFAEARGLVEGIDFDRRLKDGSNPRQTIRLLFILSVLSGIERKPEFESLIASQSRPVAIGALNPYAGHLLRKAERPPLEAEETQAIHWMANALSMEFAHLSGKGMEAEMPIRLLVLDGRTEEAFKLAGIHGKFTFLAFFLWVIGDVDLAGKALAADAFAKTESKDLLITRAITAGLVHSPEKALPHLNELLILDTRYFIDCRSPTLWGVAALLFKAMGQFDLFAGAVRLARERDPLFKDMREHLANRIQAPAKPVPFPDFEMPAGFKSRKCKEEQGRLWI